ncbi:MAG: 2-hydroxyglutaryl-CoA dehydratase [Acidobacteria bacterium]|nr:2-hydroxyglutaryl-CoA dehydratase [Acidobacteriota bacterium]
MNLTAGIDLGSTYTKVVITGENDEIAGRASIATGYNFNRAAERGLREALEAAGGERADVVYVAATGYGRYMVPFRDLAITELTCHAHATHRILPQVRTMLDIGGQTVKAIRMDERGRVRAFRLNDKCAAGSGAFLEKTVRYMSFETSDIPRLTEAATDPATVSSVCAVFAESEVINHLAAGRSVEDVCAGAVVALAGRAAQLVKRVKPEQPYALSGGLTRVPLMRRELEALLKCEFLVAEDELGPFAGAQGAALLAHQRVRRLSERASA